MKAHDVSLSLLLRAYRWHAETLDRFKQIRTAAHLEPSPCYGDAPEMIEWRRTAMRGVTDEAREAAVAYDKVLSDLVDGTAGAELQFWIDEWDRWRAEARVLWTCAAAWVGGETIPPWEATNGASGVESEVST